MNNWLYKLERKYGKYAVPNLTVFVIFTYIIGYLMEFMGGYTDLIALNPYLIMKGQVWRIFTWILMPPSTLSLFTVIMLFFYFQIGRSLEVTWGDFRYNVYLFMGFLFTLIGSFVIYFIGIRLFNYPVEFGYSLSALVSTYYVNMSLFFAFAASYPDMQIMLYFFIPLKIKYLAILDGVLIFWQFLQSPWFGKGIIVVSLLNFLVFYLSTKNIARFSPYEMHRRRSFQKAVDPDMRSRFHTVNGGKTQISKHRCAICGRTELDSPGLEFRFCSKCNGNYVYFSEHINNHTHK